MDLSLGMKLARKGPSLQVFFIKTLSSWPTKSSLPPLVASCYILDV